MPADILNRIVTQRIERRAREGSAQGISGLESEGFLSRTPLPFPTPMICEVKRRSPSRGVLTEDSAFDPVAQAKRYTESGECAISVLTEQDHFSGSLVDLVSIRRELPDTPILRKDFLIDIEDIRISRLAGADAVLLIAAILSSRDFAALYRETERQGITALVEIHDEEDLEKVRSVRPRVLGINSRDLHSFRVDLLAPLSLAEGVDWPCILVFESGISEEEDALLVRDGGFSSILVGEAVMKQPERSSRLAGVLNTVRPITVLGKGPAPSDDDRRLSSVAGGSLASEATGVSSGAPGGRAFWSALAAARRLRAPERPLVKICGITNRRDAELARELGADVLGLIYAPSPRVAPKDLAAELAHDIGLPLVGVVVEDGRAGRHDDVARDTSSPSAGNLLHRAQADLKAGHLAALQLHGTAAPEEALSYGWPYYKAIRPSDPEEARAAILAYRSPRILVDAYDRERAGGTGRRVEEAILEAVADAFRDHRHGTLWLAGGLDPDNVAAAIRRWRPELIDASSGLESKPGKKDPEKMRLFFAAIERMQGEER